MTKISCVDHDIINVYRSNGASSNLLISDLRKFVNESKETFVVGDMNICFKSQRSHPVLRYIEAIGFSQLVQKPTHKEGRMIDHIFHYQPDSSANRNIKVSQQSSYFSDHDLLFVVEVIDFFFVGTFTLISLGIIYWRGCEGKKNQKPWQLGEFPSQLSYAR